MGWTRSTVCIACDLEIEPPNLNLFRRGAGAKVRQGNVGLCAATIRNPGTATYLHTYLGHLISIYSSIHA